MVKCPNCNKYEIEFNRPWHRWQCLHCNWISEIRHYSPNYSESDSLIFDAEVWLLSQELKIPDEHKYPHLFQGMIDDYLESQ